MTTENLTENIEMIPNYRIEWCACPFKTKTKTTFNGRGYIGEKIIFHINALRLIFI